MRNRWLAASFLAAAAVVGLAACGSSSPSTPSGSTTSNPPAAAPTSTSTSSASSNMAAGIKTATAGGRVVLIDAQGFTLYWYAPDTATASNCTGSCATAWPPLIGTPSFASGVSLTGKLGTIKRADGSTQATYDGHPLYLFKADTSAGAAKGNKASGIWWIMTVSGKKIQAAITSTSASSGGSSSSSSGGYGY
jgi:predicted lipoprotein with Yx(FWY)xxD motif